ncbi:MAG TPA: hypothetical protein PKE04_22245 [Clostridia bacterium]|nr:hypothetical protein [Clostridia bacterium]
MKELLGMTLGEMEALLAEWSEKPFRAKQLFAFVYRGTPFDRMLSLPKALRDRLQAEYCVNGVSILACRTTM